jgi:hypothetical protein
MNPEDRIRELPFPWWFRPGGGGPVTDPIDMEFIIRDLDPAVRNRVIGARLEAVAKVHGNIAEIHRNIADAAMNISKIVVGKTK